MGYTFIPSGGGGLGSAGPAGADGSLIESGSSLPPTSGSAQGQDRFWLDTTEHKFYKLTANSAPNASNWLEVADFTGNTGATGNSGADGDKWSVESLSSALPADKGSADTFDEYKLDSDSGNIYYLASGETTGWSSLGTLIGPQGTQGVAGNTGLTGNDGNDGLDGIDGTQWTASNSVPTSGSGSGGDFHYKIDTREIYRKDVVQASTSITLLNNLKINDTISIEYEDSGTQTATITVIGSGSSDTTFTSGAANLVRNGSQIADASDLQVLLNSINGYSASVLSNVVSIFADNAGDTYNFSISLSLDGNNSQVNASNGADGWGVLATIGDGADGEKGDTGTISIGDVVAGAVGTDPTVENVGSATAAILNFSIPAGTQGDTGETGEDGSLWTSSDANKTEAEGKLGDFHLNNSTFDVFRKSEVPHVSQYVISVQDDGQSGVNFDSNGILSFDSFDENDKATYRKDETPDPDYIITYDNVNSRWELRLDDDIGSGFQSPVFAYNNLSDSEDSFYPNVDTWSINVANWTSSTANVGIYTPTLVAAQKNHWYKIANLKIAGQGVPEGGTLGQVLRKKSDGDYDTEWVSASTGGGSGLTNWVEDANGHLIPNEDAVYNIGSLTKQIKDLYVSAESIYLGGNKLSIDSGDNITYLVDGETNPLPLTKNGGTALVGGEVLLEVGTVTTGIEGSQAQVSIFSTPALSTLSFSIPKGDTGEQGIKGDDGYNGSISILSSVADAASLPSTGNSNGDGRITEDTGKLHVWDGTTWQDLGQVKGDKGDAGSAPNFLSGAQEPLSTDGINGDMFFNTLTGDLYGPKASGAWPASPMVNLRGPTGVAGQIGTNGLKGETGDAATIAVGTTTSVNFGTAPSVTNSGSNTAAILDFNIPKGERGEKGEEGNTNAITITGTVADSSLLPSGLGQSDVGNSYITEDNNHLSVWTGTDFISVGAIRGPEGTKGLGFTGGSYSSTTGKISFTSDDGLEFQTDDLRGTDGQNANNWSSGTDNPNNLNGQDGDFYFNTTSNTFHKKESGAWTIITDLPTASGAPANQETIILELTQEFEAPQVGTVSHVKALRLPYNFRLTGVTAYTNQVFNQNLEITLLNNGTNMFTTPLTIESGVLSSTDNVVQPVVNTAARDVLADAIIKAGTIWAGGSGYGVKLALIGERL
jgi:hypothetical protein